MVARLLVEVMFLRVLLSIVLVTFLKILWQYNVPVLPYCMHPCLHHVISCDAIINTLSYLLTYGINICSTNLVWTSYI